jgi:hypothetical protein
MKDSTIKDDILKSHYAHFIMINVVTYCMSASAFAKHWIVLQLTITTYRLPERQEIKLIYES